VLGPWVNKPWLNLFAGLIVGVLIVLSMILVISTVIPSIDVTRLLVVLGSAMVGVLLAARRGSAQQRTRGARARALTDRARELADARPSPPRTPENGQSGGAS